VTFNWNVKISDKHVRNEKLMTISEKGSKTVS